MKKSIVYVLIGLAMRFVVAFLFEKELPIASVGYFFSMGAIGCHLENMIEKKSK